MADKRINIVISSVTKGVTSGIRRATGALKRMGAVASRVGRVLRSFAGGLLRAFNRLALGAAGAAVAVGGFVRSFMVQQDAVAALAAALRNNGDEVDKLLPKYEKFAAEMQKVTIHGDEFILQQMALARNLGVGADELENVTKAAIGLSAKIKKDLATSMQLLARALNGDTAMLKRYGISIDENLTAQEKFNALVKLGAGAFGLAEEEAKTLSGRFDQMKNAASDLSETIGGGIAKGLRLSETFLHIKKRIEKLIETLTETGVIERWAGTVRKALDKVVDVIKVITTGTAEQRSIVIQGVKDMGTQIATTLLQMLVRGAGLVGQAIWGGIKAGMFGGSQHGTEGFKKAAFQLQAERTKEGDAYGDRTFRRGLLGAGPMVKDIEQRMRQNAITSLAQDMVGGGSISASSQAFMDLMGRSARATEKTAENTSEIGAQ